MKIDPACYADGDEFPKALRKGARVRLTGGTLECGVPTGPLKQRRWKVGTADNVGLSDRMEYRKDLDGDGLVELIFRKFDDDETKTEDGVSEARTRTASCGSTSATIRSRRIRRRAARRSIRARR